MKKIMICICMIFMLLGCEKENTLDTPPVVDQPKSTFSIQFIDVGQGDAAIVECDGHYMLIDGGNKSESSKIYTILKERKIDHLDIIVATNTNDEHIGGIAGALNYATYDKFLCNTDDFNSDAFLDMLKYVELGKGIQVPYVGDYFTLGSAGVQVIGGNFGDGNDASIVLRVTYGENSFVFASDIEEFAEKEVINTTEKINADVLKIANHGSDFSSTIPFIQRIDPKYAVISVGKDNGKGYPNLDTLKTLSNHNIYVYRTDLHGDIWCTSDGKTITFTTERTVSKELLYKEGITKVDDGNKQTNKTEEIPNVTLKDLSEANRTTKLINTYGAFRKVSNPGMDSEFVEGYYLVNNKMAKIMSYGFGNSANVSYEGWYDGYVVYYDQDHMKMFVLVESLEGEGYPYDYDTSYLFTEDKKLELESETKDTYTYKVIADATTHKVIVDKKTLEVQEVFLNDNSYYSKYEYGKQEDCPTILASWIGELKTVSVYCQLMVNNSMIQYYKEFEIPMDWELEMGSYIYDVESYSDMNFVNPYEYPGHASNYTVYVTNVKG
ncbi:MAG: MBL fold metallo-hydrolase [Erysipelotrichaceae bacterium]|nr:MBL fold metallo-hydrolase [Erysipelotrichaceae bacterium]